MLLFYFLFISQLNRWEHPTSLEIQVTAKQNCKNSFSQLHGQEHIVKARPNLESIFCWPQDSIFYYLGRQREEKIT